MVNKTLCIALHDAIVDELKAAEMYSSLAIAIEVIDKQSELFRKIKRDEAKHHRELSELYQQIGCDAEVTDILLEKNQQELPLNERIRRAKKFVSEL